MSETLSRDMLISIAGHIAVVLIIFFQAVLIPREPLDLRSAIRVDVVGLPQKIEEPPAPQAKAPEEPAKPKPLPPKDSAAEPVSKPVAPQIPSTKAKKTDIAKSQKEALNKLKRLEALEKIKNQMKKETAEKSKAQGAVVKGNQVHEGNRLTGLEKIEYDRYFDELEQRIRAQWNIPEWMADAQFKAQVQVLIDEQGNVIRKIFRRSSGNVVFDNSVIAAIDGSSPLPPPPKRLRGLLETSGIIFNFPE